MSPIKALRVISVFALFLTLSLFTQATNPQAASQLSTLPTEAQASISAALRQQAELRTKDNVAGFGYAVAVSGDTIVIGSYISSTAYVFVKPASGWKNMTKPTARLTAPDNISPHFGAGVGISGHTIVVSAPMDFNYGTGVAYVYEEPAGGWADMTETARLTSSSPIDMGWNLAISGDTIVIGAGGAKVKGVYASGRVFVFTKPPGGWTDMTQTAQLTEPNEGRNSYFGAAVAIANNTIVVGEIGYNSFSGALYVYEKGPHGWKSGTKCKAILTASDGVAGDQLGAPGLAIRGNMIVAGAMLHPYSSDNGAGPGAAYLFVKPASGWATTTETAELATADAGVSYFGGVVAMNDNDKTVLVGADFSTVGSNPSQGSAYLYHEPNGGWGSTSDFARKLVASDGVIGGVFGGAVAISIDTMVISAPGQSTTGAVYVFAP